MYYDLLYELVKCSLVLNIFSRRT